MCVCVCAGEEGGKIGLRRKRGREERGGGKRKVREREREKRS